MDKNSEVEVESHSGNGFSSEKLEFDSGSSNESDNGICDKPKRCSSLQTVATCTPNISDERNAVKVYNPFQKEHLFYKKFSSLNVWIRLKVKSRI